eukprot:scaffold187467_cov18-Prasinocladus_malaysianus.AAC.2
MAVVAVFGAGGNVASHVTRAVLSRLSSDNTRDQSRQTTVRLVTRDPDALKESIEGSFAGLDVQIYTGSVTDGESLPAALQGVDRVFFCMPQCLSSADMIKVSNQFTVAAKAADVKVVRSPAE